MDSTASSTTSDSNKGGVNTSLPPNFNSIQMKIFRQTRVEDSETLQTRDLDLLPAPVTLQAARLAPNPFYSEGFGTEFTTPRYVGIPTHYAYVDAKGVPREARYEDPAQKRRDRKTGEMVDRTKIFIQDGFLIIEPNKPGLYEFLKHHPNNGSFEDRDTSKPVTFLAIPPAKSEEERANEKMKVVTAQAKIASMSLTQLIEVGKQHGAPAGLTEYKLRNELFSMAESNPDAFLKDAPVVSGTAGKVQKALDEKLIRYAPKTSTFAWDAEFNDEDRTILITQSGKDVELLTQHFDDNKELLSLLEERIQQ